MATAIISAASAIVVGLLSFLGVLVSNRKANIDMIHKYDVARAITDTKIEELTREVRLHNNFAQRIPVIENEIKTLKNYHK
jgi:phage-related protein